MTDTETRFVVLDTNVLMDDPAAIFRFQNHNVFIPAIVLEELDRAKKGNSDIARNVRAVSRFLDDLLEGAGIEDIKNGIPITTRVKKGNGEKERPSGRLFFQMEDIKTPAVKADHQILEAAQALTKLHPSHTVVVISKDINLRIAAATREILAENYNTEQVIDDIDLLHKGHRKFPDNFWNNLGPEVKSWTEGTYTFYSIPVPEGETYYPGLYINDLSGREFVVLKVEDDIATITTIDDYTKKEDSVWGITARNSEQGFALDALMNPDIDFVSILGEAGTGKTLLTLAAGLSQVLDHGLYNEIIMTRVTVPVADDIGFLPGTEEEKMTPWMGALMDNLEVLSKTESKGEWGRAATDDLLQSRIRIHSINYMRGRTFLSKYIIIDEAQNLTVKQMKTLISRAGPDTKIVCLGNLAQIDTPYLTETTSGITHVVDKFKNWEHGRHVTLVTGERSRLADAANALL